VFPQSCVRKKEEENVFEILLVIGQNIANLNLIGYPIIMLFLRAVYGRRKGKISLRSSLSLVKILQT
jgi:hypothetical protein